MVNIRGPVQKTLARFGYMLAKRPLEGSLERELTRLLEYRQIDTLVDVGAHEGRYGSMLRDLGFVGRIISFEPSCRPRARLEHRADQAWEVHPYALGDENGHADFFDYSKHDELASLHRPTELGRSWGTDDHTVSTVTVRRLDDIADELGIRPELALLKIDTQGHDLAVLEGGERFAASAAGLQIEVPMFNQYEASASALELLERAFSLGFNLLGLYPVHAHPRPIAPVEFDAVFVRIFPST